MAYVKQTWVDRLVQFAHRYTKTDVDSSTVDLIAAPGTVTKAGTPVDAEHLNHMEEGIYDAAERADDTYTISEADALLAAKGEVPKVWPISIAPNAWTATPAAYYQYSIDDASIVPNTKVWLDADSGLNGLVNLSYSCGAGSILLLTDKLPTATLTGRLITMAADSQSAMSGQLKHRPRITNVSLAAVSGSTTGSVEIASGYTFADFDEILFRWTTQSGSTVWTRDTRTAIVESSGRFGASELSYVDSSNVQHWCGAEYVDATHVTISRGSNSGGTLYIYGRRLM